MSRKNNNYKHLGELNNEQIDNYYRNNPYYGGNFSKNDINRIQDNKFYILNMDKENSGGSHWVLLWLLNSQYCIYFDSFGIVPPSQIKTIANRFKNGFLMYNTRILQGINEADCGYWAIFVADHLLKGIDFITIMSWFSTKTESNLHILQRYFKNRIV